MCLAVREAEKRAERAGLERRSQELRDTGKQLQHAALALGNLVQVGIESSVLSKLLKLRGCTTIYEYNIYERLMSLDFLNYRIL